MEETIVNFQTARLAREKGFHELVATHYKDKLVMPHKVIIGGSKNYEEGIISAPRQSFLQKWLRDEHDLWVLPEIKKHKGLYYVNCDVWIDNKASYLGLDNLKLNYEDALEKGIVEALKLI